MPKHYHKSFTEDEITTICGAYINGTGQVALKKQWDISIKLVYNIVHRKIYKHYNVEGNIPNYLDRLANRTSRGGRPKVEK